MSCEPPVKTTVVEFQVNWQQVLNRDYYRPRQTIQSLKPGTANKQVFVPYERLKNNELDLKEYVEANSFSISMRAKVEEVSYAYRKERTVLGLTVDFKSEFEALIFKMYAS